MKRHSFYIDSHRHLIGEAVLGVQGEHQSDVLCVVCPRYWGERDLSLSDFTLAFRVGDYFEEIHPESVSVETDITLYFPITRTLTAKVGKVTIGIIARVGDECVFKSENAECVVKSAVFGGEEISGKFPEELTLLQNSVNEVSEKFKQTNNAISLLEESKADKNLVREDILSLGEELSDAISKVDTRKMNKLSTHSGNLAGLSNGTVCDSGFSIELLEGKFFRLSHNGETLMIFEKRDLNITNFYDVQTIVRSGLANRYFKVGDTIRCKKGEDIIEWVVIGIDEDTPSDSRYTHSLTLMAKNACASFQYDSIQALYYCNGYYNAGTFHMNIGGQLYAFTSAYPLKQGAQIYVNSARTIVELYEHAYTQTYYEQCTLEKVDEAPEGSTELTPLNNLSYAAGGCNEYLASPIKLWLNSQESNWWTPHTFFSRQHYKAPYTKGFLYDVDREFLNVLGEVKKKTYQNGENVLSNEKIFLLSADESGVSQMYGEGKKYSYFDSKEKRVKMFNGTPTRWWLRTPRDQQNEVWTVDVTGGLNHNICSSAAGVCPVCCIV